MEEVQALMKVCTHTHIRTHAHTHTHVLANSKYHDNITTDLPPPPPPPENVLQVPRLSQPRLHSPSVPDERHWIGHKYEYATLTLQLNCKPHADL